MSLPPTTPSPTTPLARIQLLTQVLHHAVARKDHEAEAFAVAAASAIQRENASTEQEAFQQAALTNQQPRTKYLDSPTGKDGLYRHVREYLRNYQFPEDLKHELREEKEAWKAWHSVPNEVRSDVGKTIIRRATLDKMPCFVGTEWDEDIEPAVFGATRLRRLTPRKTPTMMLRPRTDGR